jgi:hypothetical protein
MKSLIVLSVLFSIAFAQTTPKDSVIVKVTTSTYNGNYAPRNSAMMWIQKPDKTFIKTISKKAQNYIRYCTLWNSIAKNDVDGLTGASRNNHGELTGKWDCTGQDGKTVTDGTYEFWVEFTENNGTGKNAHGSIVIDGKSKTATVADATNFKKFSAVYTASPRVDVKPQAMTKMNTSVIYAYKSVKIVLPVTTDYKLSLSGLNGRTLKSIAGTGSSASLSTDNLSAGVYNISLTHGNKQVSFAHVIN